MMNVVRWWLSILVVGAVLQGGAVGAAYGQEGRSDDEEATYTMAVREVPLDEALQRFIRQTRADIAYSSDLVRKRTAYCRIRGATEEAVLRCLLAGTGLDYLRTSGGTYLLVEERRGPDARGGLAGTVVDAATGEPLPQANVLLADASTGTSTNQAGRFQFASVLSGPHRLVVTYVGYATAVDTVWIPSDGRRTVTVSLDPRILEGEPVVVDGLQQRLPSARLGRGEVEVDERMRLPGGSLRGGLRNASRQTGVQVDRPRASIHVQGGGDGENVTLVDGVPVREPISLGGLTSVFSPKALDRLVVHKTGFEASRGSYTSGVVETTHDLRRPNTPSGQPSLSLSADPVSVDARADLEWDAGGGRPGQAMVAARRSVWEAYRAPSLHHLLDTWTQPDPALTARWIEPSASAETVAARRPGSDVGFVDLHAAVRQPLSPFRQVYVSGYHGSHRLGTTVGHLLQTTEPSADARALTTRTHNAWENTAVQARYNWIAGSRTTGMLQLYGSRHDSRTFFGLRDAAVTGVDPTDESALDSVQQSAEMLSPDGADHSAEGNRLTEAGVKARLDVSLAPGVHVEVAVEPRHFRGTFHVRNRFLGAIGHETRAWQVGSYAQGTASLGLGTTVTAGTRLTYVPARQSVYAEPRASVRADRPETAVGHVALRLAGGIYRQYVLQADVSSSGPTDVVPSVQFWLPLDGSLSPPRAYHASTDVLVRPSDAWTLRLETYAKWQPQTVAVDYAGIVRAEPLDDVRQASMMQVGRQSDLFAVGEGRAYGAALRVQRDADRLSGDVTAEVSRVHRRYPGRFGDRFVPAPWETPLELSANVDVRVGGGVHAVGSWSGQWGRSWALRRAYYDYVALSGGIDGYDLDRPSEQRLAPFSRIDLGLRTKHRVGGVTLQVQAGALNVLGRANPFDWSLDAASAQTGSAPRPIARTLPGRRFYLKVSAQL